MARTRKYLKIVDLAQSKGGRLDANDPDLAALIGAHVIYKLPTYMWALRKKHGIAVTAIRQGRKVVAYQFEAGAVNPNPNPVMDAPDEPNTPFAPTDVPEMSVPETESEPTPSTTVSGGWSVTSK